MPADRITLRTNPKQIQKKELLLFLRVLISSLLALVVCAGQADGQQWRELRPGMEFSFLDASESSRSGGSRLACLRLDPKHVRFSVLAVPDGREGHTAGEWRRQTGALAVVNAGQFASDRSYLGLLVSGGRSRGHLAQKLEALFAAEPEVKSLPLARVIDLRYTAYRIEDSPYREVAQSLMLLDRFRQIRVRKSPKVAHRTVVAEDNTGRILVMVSEGGHTLWELAYLLAGSPLKMREVMCMDGGGQSQLDIMVDDFMYSQYGDPTDSPDLPLPWPTPSLPAALGVFPR